jgi:ligand-binding sensor domain-containing protein
MRESSAESGPGVQRVGSPRTAMTREVIRMQRTERSRGIRGGILAGRAFALAAAILVAAGASRGASTQLEAVVFARLSIEEGLSQSIVECILQDSRGFMWFGTQDGLNRYDGYKFVVLRQNPKDPNSLNSNWVLSLCEDRTGLIWIGMFNGGLNSYDPATDRFARYRAIPGDASSLSHDLVRTIFEDSRGTIWVGTDGGLNRFDRRTGAFVQYHADPNDPRSLSSDAIRKIGEDRSGFLWIGTDNGLNRFDRASGESMRFRNVPGDPRSLSDNAVRSIYRDRNGVLWIGTENGLNAYDPRTRDFTRFMNDPGDPASLSNNAVYSILEDTKSVLWVGTNGGGLDRLDRKTGKFSSFRNDPFDPLSLSYNEIYSLCEDRSGVLWIGTWGGGLSMFDTKKKEFAHYKRDANNPNSLSHKFVWSFYEDADGILWIGTHGGGLDRLDRGRNEFGHYRHDPRNPNSLSNDIVRVIAVDRSGALWLGTNGGGIDRFDTKSGRFTSYRNEPDDSNSPSNDEIRCIFVDRGGLLWIGTNGGGMNSFDPSTGRFTRYRNDTRDPNSLSNDFVRAIYQDAGGTYWIGTQGGGLNRFERESGKFTSYRSNPNDSSSISNDFLMSICESKAGDLWIGTWGGGLDRFDRARGTFERFTEQDGLSGNAIYGALEDEEGNLWLSTNNGISRFNPKTKAFKNYTVQDGLQSKEFNAGAYFKSRSGEMFFGGIDGFNAFYPENIKDNSYIPPVVVTSFTKLNREVKLDVPVSELRNVKLSYRDYVFSFEFAALDFTAPNKNQYAYRMEGLDRDWVYTSAAKRFANYTTLRPGKYVFRVKGSNNDGVWNEAGTAVAITITPPFWGTWWFRALVLALLAPLAIFWYRRRRTSIFLEAELRAAHDAQMSIMPHDDPVVSGFDVSGICIPASEVGGDFFDYFWLDGERTKFGLAVGDVSGKAMKAAMIAVMTNGMIASKANERFSPRAALTELNHPLFGKTNEETYTALWLGALDVRARIFTYANAGLLAPLLKRSASVREIESEGPRFPLGALQDTVYEERSVRLEGGDVLVLFTDGVTDARNGDMEFYDYNCLKRFLEIMNTSGMSAGEIKDKIVEDVKRFVGSAPQRDDMTVVVVKAL